MTPEKLVQNKIIKYLKELEKKGEPIYFERRQAGGFSYKAGLADLYVVYNGIHYEVEAKRKNGKTRPLQDKWKRECENKNIKYILIDNWEDIKKYF